MEDASVRRSTQLHAAWPRRVAASRRVDRREAEEGKRRQEGEEPAIQTVFEERGGPGVRGQNRPLEVIWGLGQAWRPFSSSNIGNLMFFERMSRLLGGAGVAANVACGKVKMLARVFEDSTHLADHCLGPTRMRPNTLLLDLIMSLHQRLGKPQVRMETAEGVPAPKALQRALAARAPLRVREAECCRVIVIVTS